REQPTWWIRYRADGREHRVSTHSADRAVAEDLLKTFGGADDRTPADAGPKASPDFEQAAAQLLADYRLNARRSLRTLTLRIANHLRPFSGPYRLTALPTPLVRAFITARQAEGASNATINRDLITLKRMCALSVQDGTLATKPYIPLLKEHNIRRGF